MWLATNHFKSPLSATPEAMAAGDRISAEHVCMHVIDCKKLPIVDPDAVLGAGLTDNDPVSGRSSQKYECLHCRV